MLNPVQHAHEDQFWAFEPVLFGWLSTNEATGVAEFTQTQGPSGPEGTQRRLLGGLQAPSPSNRQNDS